MLLISTIMRFLYLTIVPKFLTLSHFRRIYQLFLNYGMNWVLVLKCHLKSWLDMAGCLWTVLGGKWGLLQNLSRGSGLKKHIKLSSQLSMPEVMLRTRYLINDRQVLIELKLRSELCYYMWAGSRGRYNDWLQAGRSGDRIPLEARFSAPAQNGPGAHPASCTMGTGSFLG